MSIEASNGLLVNLSPFGTITSANSIIGFHINKQASVSTGYILALSSKGIEKLAAVS
jgi:hypothetical protein